MNLWRVHIVLGNKNVTYRLDYEFDFYKVAMKKKIGTTYFACRWWPLWSMVFLVAGAGCQDESPSQPVAEVDTFYEFQDASSPEGTGKFYLGREIAGGADIPGLLDWLERPAVPLKSCLIVSYRPFN